MGLLPTTKTVSETKDPKNLILFGLPKAGKTTTLAQLPKSLLIDLENGSTYVSGYIMKAQTHVDLFNIAKALKTEEHDFKYVILDTVTALEDIALPYANELYRATPVGKDYDPNTSVLKLPMGAGYGYLREAMQTIIGWFEKVVENVILVGHVKDKMITQQGTDLNVKALDLSGKISNILSAKSDAICYVFRDPESNKLMANFGALNDVLCGSRLPQLSGKTICLSEHDDQGKLITHWETIYPSLNESK